MHKDFIVESVLFLMCYVVRSEEPSNEVRPDSIRAERFVFCVPEDTCNALWEAMDMCCEDNRTTTTSGPTTSGHIETTRHPETTRRPETTRHPGTTEYPGLFPVTLPKGCGLQDPKQNLTRIYGGMDTALGEFPWMALLAYNKSGNRYPCTGFLISSKYVLTAGHCTSGQILTTFGNITKVRLGEYDMESNPDCVSGVCAPFVRDLDVAQVITHPRYRPNDIQRYHDIALLRLSEDVTFSDFTRPICISKSGTVKPGDMYLLAGWGKTELASYSPRKLKVAVPILPNENCTKAYSGVSNITLSSGQICAGGERGADSCRGDSGAPLMGSVGAAGGMGGPWFAVGVVSFGPSPCGTKGYPAVYTKVAAYMDWIESVITN